MSTKQPHTANTINAHAHKKPESILEKEEKKRKVEKKGQHRKRKEKHLISIIADNTYRNWLKTALSTSRASSKCV